MTVALTGVSLGLAAAFAVTQLMKSLVVRRDATDPATFEGVGRAAGGGRVIGVLFAGA